MSNELHDFAWALEQMKLGKMVRQHTRNPMDEIHYVIEGPRAGERGKNFVLYNGACRCGEIGFYYAHIDAKDWENYDGQH